MYFHKDTDSDSKRNVRFRELFFIVLLVFVSAFLRMWQLGYSDFYGDETKVFYLRKDVGAKDFLFNQRKGPVQFLVAWSTEKFAGSYDEFFTRFPYSIAGIASVLVLYFLVKEMFSRNVAVLASLFFSFSGFYIAFSRTVQYQSFLIFFGLVSILAFYLYMRLYSVFYKLNSSTSNESDEILASPKWLLWASQEINYIYISRLLLAVSGISLALSYLSHWDALFYDLVLGVVLVYFLTGLTNGAFKKQFFEILVFLIIPFCILVGLYYLPYFYNGFFAEYVSGYISRRTSGSNQLINNSSYTYWYYNPSYIYYIPFLFVPFAFRKYSKGLQFEIILLLIWFIVPFIAFQYFISNPGTHTQNYYIPLIILSAVGIDQFRYFLNSKSTEYIFLGSLTLLLGFMYYFSSVLYVPFLNSGYPWKSQNALITDLHPLDKTKNQYFVYGFPYNRGWRQVREYFEMNGMPRSFNTNDNLTIGEFYLHGVPAHRMVLSQLPEYYIHVIDNQESAPIHDLIQLRYEFVTEFYVENQLVSKLYKLKDTPPPSAVACVNQERLLYSFKL